MEENKLVRIATFYNQFDAEIVKLKLEENDVYCFIKNEHVAQLQFGLANFELYVRQQDKETALNLLNSENIPE